MICCRFDQCQWFFLIQMYWKKQMTAFHSYQKQEITR